MDHITVFDIWADYAHFKKIYTTTSPLSYLIPPRTTICGLLGAILGIDKTKYIELFNPNKASIALRILQPIKKTRIAMNLIDTKIAPMMSKIKTRTQIRFEFLKNVKYRIYFYHNDLEINNTFNSLIKEHKCVYTPCLGLSGCIANFVYVSDCTATEKRSNDFIKIHSVIPIPTNQQIVIDFEESGEYFQEVLPRIMKPDRVVIEYQNVSLERNGNLINAKVESYWELNNNERIIFL